MRLTSLDRRLVGIPAKEEIFNSVFGSYAWAALNLEANVFAALPKSPWDKSGWRIIGQETSRNSS